MDSQISFWMANLTIAEKCLLLGGASTWRTHPIERLGIPAIKMSDGPNGVRGESLGSRRTRGVAIPVGIAIGASWDVDLALALGDLLGKEAIRKSTHVVLGPTINIQRTPIGGRTFECISEDPELTAQIGLNIVRGIQGNAVAATVKHFVGNDTERDRHNIDVRIDDRTMREVYLRPFEAVVIDSQVWAIMSAYNLVDEVHCSENFQLLNTIARQQWKFDGVVVSDWFGSHSTTASAQAGLDIAMPGPETIYGSKLEAAVANAEVSQVDLDARVKAVLQLILRTQAMTRSANNAETTVDDSSERQLCYQAAAAGSVLVRNRDSALPLDDKSIQRIAVIGPNAKLTRFQGGGSSSMKALSSQSILQAASDRFGDHKVSHAVGVAIDKMAPICQTNNLRTPTGERGLRVDYYNGDSCQSEIVYTDIVSSSVIVFFGSCPVGVNPDNFSIRVTGSYLVEVDGEHEVSLVVTGPTRFTLDDEVLVDDPLGNLPRSTAYFGFGSSEQVSRSVFRVGDAKKIDITMTTRAGFSAVRLGIRKPQVVDTIAQAVQSAQDADVAVVVVGTNDEWETEGQDRETIALPGQQDELITRVCQVAKKTIVVVNAGSPVAMPWFDQVDAVLISFFGGMEMSRAVLDILCGDVDPGGRLPITYPKLLSDCPAWESYLPVENVQTYSEKLNVGYRGHLANKIDPLLAFGFGLSYGDSQWGNAVVTVGTNKLPSCKITMPLISSSSRQATVVVQGYVRKLSGSRNKEAAKLGGWHKCTLEPGENRLIDFEIPWIAFRFWDCSSQMWVVEPGEYEIAIGKSSVEICQRLVINLPRYEVGPELS